MLITGIKSRPVYDELTPMASGLSHVAAAQGSGGGPLVRLLGEMDSDQLAATTVLYSTESFTGQNYLANIQKFTVRELIVFQSNADTVKGLDAFLATATMGTRLYISGSEGFIGTSMQVATSYGVNRDEVLREHAGSFVRRVWCAHCSHYSENVTRRIFQCPGCQRNLIVRDHYSGRLAAFQGVKADGEVPGELPDNEELDT
ncbi:dimethylamine monooxygenase subunit DmmA family protein [Pseudarthrobacter sp. H3Y2-7]|uniref:dimethylamine monooxygenase subunit DmmA family protein n=1 Tax=Pseudarthrobacter naphthalenicus TaxID=3031328 RepID=UPI0023B2029B|nr:dimethylamine monooxygenase subunit DmmA family protein [Pseudarthrobacter sp. H3Y2-7]MDE8669552.1 dimethylamine monooxygenase subunit DmmA family protein [Pseudarthrobacter sp. H3Y2-7]